MLKSLLRSRSENARETSESILELMRGLASHLKNPSIHNKLSLCKWWDKEVSIPENSHPPTLQAQGNPFNSLFTDTISQVVDGTRKNNLTTPTMLTLKSINAQLSEAIDTLQHEKVQTLRIALCTQLNKELERIGCQALYDEYQRLDKKYFDYCENSFVQPQSQYRTTEAYKMQYPKVEAIAPSVFSI